MISQLCGDQTSPSHNADDATSETRASSAACSDLHCQKQESAWHNMGLSAVPAQWFANKAEPVPRQRVLVQPPSGPALVRLQTNFSLQPSNKDRDNLCDTTRMQMKTQCPRRHAETTRTRPELQAQGPMGPSVQRLANSLGTRASA